jgi:hypothetical protein
MAKQITMWEAEDGTRFNTADEAAHHDAALRLRNDIRTFLTGHDIASFDAADVARIISQNVSWFRTRLDAAAGEMRAGVWAAAESASAPVRLA